MGMRKDPNFGYLMLGLLIWLIIGPIARTFFGDMDGIILLMSYNAIMIVGIWSLLDDPKFFLAGIVLAGISIAASLGQIVLPSMEFMLSLTVLSMLLIFSVISSVIISQHIFTTTKVTANVLIGSACVFMFLGLNWTILYVFILLFDPGAFSGVAAIDGSGEDNLFWDMTYFSFVTLTTLGYGDIGPLSPLARALAYMEAVIGQLYTVLLVGVLVGAYIREDINSPAE